MIVCHAKSDMPNSQDEWRRLSSCSPTNQQYATIDYTPDGSYMNDINKHTTYKEINEHIVEKYGFRLHSAYITQVKCEMSIRDGRENYNLSKSDDY